LVFSFDPRCHGKDHKETLIRRCPTISKPSPCASPRSGDDLREFLYLIRNSFLFLKWNRRFGSRAFTASTTLWATGAGEFHKHSIFYPEAAGRKCLRPFQFGGRRYTETAFEGYCQPPFPVILRGVSLFGNLTEWNCTNADHRPVICFHVDRMRWQPADRRNEANDKMRNSLRAFVKSVRNTRSSRYRDGNGQK
jgi:hypothetical protein